MIAEIAEHRPNEFISIRNLGFIAKGVEDTGSDAVRARAPVRPVEYQPEWPARFREAGAELEAVFAGSA
jgi:hypothetical protein